MSDGDWTCWFHSKFRKKNEPEFFFFFFFGDFPRQSALCTKISDFWKSKRKHMYQDIITLIELRSYRDWKCMNLFQSDGNFFCFVPHVYHQKRASMHRKVSCLLVLGMLASQSGRVICCNFGAYSHLFQNQFLQRGWWSTFFSPPKTERWCTTRIGNAWTFWSYICAYMNFHYQQVLVVIL